MATPAVEKADWIDDPDSTRAKLLRAAARLFRERGFAGTSTRELAAALGVQSSSLYHYMAGKEDLLLEVCMRGNELMLTAVKQAAEESASPIDALRRAIEAHLATAVEYRDVYLTTLAEMKALPAESRAKVNEGGREYGELVRKIIADAQGQGELRTDIGADHLRLLLRNQLAWPIFWFNPDGELSISDLADLVFRGFVEGAGPLER